MLDDYTSWYESIPTFKDQKPRTLDSFLPNEKFEDDLFVAGPNSLIDQQVYDDIIDKYNSDPDNDDKKSKKSDADILNSITVWKRISELFPHYNLFPSELHCDTFKQEEIGDCYFIDIIALLSNYGELIKRLFPIKKNPHGYYEVILFINGWKRVIIDDYIPILNNDLMKPKLLGCSSKKYSDCFYFMLLEKAWAKVNQNYYNIYGGCADRSLLVLTGYKGERIDINNNLSDDEKNKIIEDIENGIRKFGHLYAVNDYGHSYSLLDVETITKNNNN